MEERETQLPTAPIFSGETSSPVCVMSSSTPMIRSKIVAIEVHHLDGKCSCVTREGDEEKDEDGGLHNAKIRPDRIDDLPEENLSPMRQQSHTSLKSSA